MKVVSNSSPLIALARIGRVEILRGLYSELYVPAAVWSEVTIQAERPGAMVVQQSGWIHQVIVRNKPLALTLTQELGVGEAEAIIAAQELPADLLILDDRQARNKARRLRLPLVGLLGVLLEAKHKGLIQNVNLLLQELQITAGFHVSAELSHTVLRQAGEI